jgi:peptidoglycan hydrolase-like protein with peptidoglycan-binding domain
MSTFTWRWGAAAFAVLSIGVGINMLAMQPPGKVARARSAQAQGPIIGQTMLIEAPVKATRASGQPAKAKSPVDAGKPAAARPAGSEPAAAAVNVELVRAIQRELNQKGYEAGSDDGVLNLISRAAIMAFEHDQGLRLTAEPSDELLRILVLGQADGLRPAGKPVQHGQEQRAQVDQIIRTVQQSLGAIGYHPARADGRTSPEMERAIREFEMDQGLPPSGRVSGALMQRLLRVAANGKLTSMR